MNILQVDDKDLVGRAFNGHDLSISLNKLGYSSYQAVKRKFGIDKNTAVIGEDFNEYIDRYISNLERELSMDNLLGGWDRYLESSELFQKADIVHYHKVHVDLIPILSFPRVASKKPSVWTIHDPWAITGHCIYIIDCDGWKRGCEDCPHLDYEFSLKQDKASQMFNIKRKVYADMDIDIIVSTELMEKYINDSPITGHFKRVHRIPFGVRLERFYGLDRLLIRNNFNFVNDDIVIGFRSDNNFIKGCEYIYKALEKITDKRIVLLTIGAGKVPDDIKNKFRTIELGWQNDENIVSEFFIACDIFLMPSLAESFGLMAVEAMAAECAIIVFKDTVLEQQVFAPDCGIAVEFKNSELLTEAINKLIINPMECKARGEKGRKMVEKYYSYKDYVKKHIDLYEEILERAEKQ